MTSPLNEEAARQLAELVLSMGMATGPGLVAHKLARQALGYDDAGGAPDSVVINTNGTVRVIPRDEPVFLVRGQDMAGGATVRGWTGFAKAYGADPAIVDSAREHAAKMDAWPVKKIPDLPQA